MKKLVFIIITLMLIKPVLPVIDYVINYDYISTQLCENKDKPELKCNGKCHLKKELAKAAEDENPISSDKKNTSKHEIEVLFLEINPSYTFLTDFCFLNKVINANYSNLYAISFANSTFHPPTNLV